MQVNEVHSQLFVPRSIVLKIVANQQGSTTRLNDIQCSLLSVRCTRGQGRYSLTHNRLKMSVYGFFWPQVIHYSYEFVNLDLCISQKNNCRELNLLKSIAIDQLRYSTSRKKWLKQTSIPVQFHESKVQSKIPPGGISLSFN